MRYLMMLQQKAKLDKSIKYAHTSFLFLQFHKLIIKQKIHLKLL